MYVYDNVTVTQVNNTMQHTAYTDTSSIGLKKTKILSDFSILAFIHNQ